MKLITRKNIAKASFKCVEKELEWSADENLRSWSLLFAWIEWLVGCLPTFIPTMLLVWTLALPRFLVRLFVWTGKWLLLFVAWTWRRSTHLGQCAEMRSARGRARLSHEKMTYIPPGDDGSLPITMWARKEKLGLISVSQNFGPFWFRSREIIVLSSHSFK